MTGQNFEIIVGPPGTGKTTTLLEKVEGYLQLGYDPREIAYLTFSKKAATEGVTRAIDKFGGTTDDYPFFRTIHSLCFRQLGLSRKQVVQREHLEEFGEMVGIEIEGRFSRSSEQSYGLSVGDKMLFLDGLARNTERPLKETWERSLNERIGWDELDRVSRSYERYKQNRGLVDYTDMLSEYLSRGVRPKIKVLIVDEGQDLTSLQWRIIHELGREAERTYIAGDDDQAIYRWAGADVTQFIRLAGQVTTLDKSYRLPRQIKRFADNIRGRISERRLKDFTSKGSGGQVEWHMDPEEVDLTEGTWLLLARNSYMLRELEQLCLREGYPYETYTGYRPVKQQTLRAIITWTRYQNGEYTSPEDIADFTRLMSPNSLRTGLWHEALDKIGAREREFYIAALRRGESLTGTPRIKVSTVHGAKGGEADRVLLLSDIAPQTYDSMVDNEDDEHRVWYVATTRAKEHLHIVEPRTPRYYDF